MQRFKLFMLDGSLSKSDLIFSIKNWKGSSNAKVNILEDDSNQIFFEYIERILRKEEYELADGTTQEIETAIYFKISVVIFLSDTNILYIKNPPRETRYTFEIVQSILASVIKIKPINIDLNDLMNNSGNVYNVIAVTASNIQYTSDVLAKATLITKSDLTKQAYDTILKYSHVIDVVKLKGAGISFEVNRVGTLKSNSEDVYTALVYLKKFFSLK